MATNVSQVLCAHKVRPSKPEQSPGQKRLVICCDGTWNNTNEAGSGPPTNVSRLSGAVAHKCCSGMAQIVYYHPGAGTESSKTARILGGAFGLGVGQDIVESYRFICDNYNPGDEIVIIGFSRGAFTARSIAGMVCALGFLNRAGLDELGSIFHDYETWQTWGERKFKYDEKKREGPLACLTLENLKRIRRFQALKNNTVPNTESDEDLIKQLDAERQDWYEKMARLKNLDAGRAQSKMQLGEIAKLYREMLAKHQLSLTTAGATPDIRVPVEGKVKAVGVWDTVGSLGIPEIPPFYHAGRSDHELKFEGLDVHPNVEHAFHAIALDEWRKSFDCTLWGKKNNTKTNLRQVWFPGTHCNVGGGWADQQIATIALAWMADQLTSVGVEFNKYEMQRIFYHVNNGVTPRKWGLGMIRNPNGATSYPDRLWSYASAPYRKIFTGDKWFNGSTDYVTRTPGAYTQDGSKDLVIKPCESVHPCVRIRYLYGGLNMDDLGPWECRSLTERGYTLERRELPQPRDSRAEGVPAPYHTILGSVAPHPAKGQAQAYFHPEQPSEEKDLVALPPAKGHWVWVDKNGKLETLPEEQIGIWERMFIRVNEKILKWKDAQEAAGAVKQEEPKGFKSWFFGSGEKKAAEPENKAAKWKDPNVPEQYGYHDFIVWQMGDLTPVPPRT